MNPEMTLVMRRNEEREALKSVIQQWNANRLDLFELSEPNENLEFHGVMRFYFQDSGQKVATKCIRVASDATVQDVIETLIEKFRPDMRMLSLPEYALFEIHENGEERKLAMDEKPLLVQLNWHKDDREGRFLLRRLDDKTNMPSNTFQQEGSSFRRKLSKREKKELKKQVKQNSLKSTVEENEARVAEKLYTELPETSFTRSISNPEMVMRRRRHQILERKLQQFRSKDGGPDTGGTLKIYGESLCRDVPYKTLLLSIRDTAQKVVEEMLNKYGLEKEDPHNYCLVQVNGNPEHSKENHNNNNGTNSQEYILDDDECPLAILMNQVHSHGSIMFHVRRRPADYHPRKRKKKPQHKWNQPQSVSNELLEYRYEDGLDRLPFFLELNPDGAEIAGGAAKRHRLHQNVTEVGCERGSSQNQSQYLQLFGPNILPRHCVIANTEGIVTVTPCSRDSETYVNGQRIYETTILRNGAIVKFGRIHCFRFMDPYCEERTRQRNDSLRNIHEYAYDRQSRDSSTAEVNGRPDTQNYETTFDVDGNIETRSTSSQGNKEDSRSQRSVGSGSKDSNRIPNAGFQRVGGGDAILPAVLEIREETEEALLNEVITALDPNSFSFKLAPAYCLYLMARYRASTHYRPELTPTERAHRLTLMLARVATIIQNVIQERGCDIKLLVLWLANSSELLNFLRSDRHISAFSIDAQDILTDAVQISFRHLIVSVQSELSAVIPHFFADKDESSHDTVDTPAGAVLGVLASAMTLFRKNRVNAALTIQIFSQLFHFINVWSFNRLIASNTNYCSRVWGLRLKARLTQIEDWAHRQGLELAANCYLARIVQAAHLLQAPKYNGEDLANISSTCFKLNSLQLRQLLMKYQPTPDEPPLPRDLIDNLVRVAENLADELARSGGREVKLEEDPELPLPFLLPEDGYTCELVRGIPPGLSEFVAPLQSMGLCRLSTQPTSNGSWTVYLVQSSVPGSMVRSPSAMSNRSAGYLTAQQEPEIHVIKLHKSEDGMGLSIVAAKGAGQDKLGIYIKSVVKGRAADVDGRLQAGDQLLKVDGQSLVGITQEKAAEYLVRTGPVVTLEIAKQGAIYHGLATLLSQPSPVMSRGVRRMSERDLPARVSNEVSNQTQLPMHNTPIHSSKSVPSLNSTGVNDGQVVSPVANRSSHEVFNPGYSNTSSSTSLHQQHPALRSRSSQNLNDSRILNNSAHTALNTNTMPGRMPSNPNQTQPYYPNQYHHMLPHQQHPMYHQHVQQQQKLLQQQQQQYQYSPHSNNIVDQTGEQFYQNVQMYRNPEMHNGSIDSSKEKVLSPQQERVSNQYQRSIRGSQTSLQQQYGNRPMNDTSPSAHIKDRPTSAYIQKENYPPSPMGMTGRSQSSRDIIRQEAKLQEMSEEVRRREMRTNNPQYYPMHQAQAQQLPGTLEGTPPYLYHRNAAMMSPHANDMQQPARPPYPSQKVGTLREEMSYRESPPPPPPPPTSTHPLYQPNAKSPDNCYNASVGEPPKGGYYPSSPGTQSSKRYQIQGTNPWEREEREREAERRRAAVKEWRDQQISELSSLGQSRNQSQDEQLRALRLEKEFERRALEEDDEDDDDAEATERVQDVMRSAREQDDVKNSSMNRSHDNYNSPRQSSAHINGTMNRSTLNLMAEKERAQRIRDMRAKSEEVDPNRIDDYKPKPKQDDEHRVSKPATRPTHLHLDTPSGMQNGPEVPPAPHQRLDHLLQQNAPPPPERGSSFAVMSHTTRPVEASNSAKKVSFQPSDSTVEKVLEDPNRFFNEAETMLNSPKSPDAQFVGATPGVIGNQEVYKDPRQRRLAEQQNQKLLNKVAPVPEKLSFKEKMKMFAMETGEEGTPKDKVKISRAQRDIDNLNSPATPNNGTSG